MVKDNEDVENEYGNVYHFKPSEPSFKDLFLFRCHDTNVIEFFRYTTKYSKKYLKYFEVWLGLIFFVWLKSKKPFVYDIGDYDRDPNVYVKNEFSPFSEYGSEVWPLWYFKKLGAGRVRVYESYGRTELEAQKGLEAAIHRKVVPVTKRYYLKHKPKFVSRSKKNKSEE